MPKLRFCVDSIKAFDERLNRQESGRFFFFSAWEVTDGRGVGFFIFFKVSSLPFDLFFLKVLMYLFLGVLVLGCSGWILVWMILFWTDLYEMY